MPSLKVANTDVTLRDFMLSQRVNTVNSTLFHAQDPADGLWGVFSTSRGLFIPCVSTDQAKEAKYGFWLITTEGPKYQLLDPETNKGTSPSFCIPYQIDDRYVFVSNDSNTHLIDLVDMRVYGGAEKSYLEIQHPGFEGVTTKIPSARKKFSILISHGLFILVTRNDNGYLNPPFIVELGTGEILETEQEN